MSKTVRIGASRTAMVEAMWREGKSDAEVAERLGVARSTLTRLKKTKLKAAHEAVFGRGDQRMLMNELDATRAVCEALDGATAAELCERYGVSEEYLRKRLAGKLNLKFDIIARAAELLAGKLNEEAGIAELLAVLKSTSKAFNPKQETALDVKGEVKAELSGTIKLDPELLRSRIRNRLEQADQ